MNRDLPPPERPLRPPQEPPQGGRGRRYNPLLIFGIPVLVVAAFYLLLVAVTAADDIFLPGNEINIGIRLPGIDSGSEPAAADIEQRINILVLGLDLRRDQPPDTPARTDTVFILSIDPYSKTAGIFYIPRDLLVNIPNGQGGYTRNRINTAYELGEYTYKDYPGGGPGLAEDTIERNFGIPIDHYVVLNFNNFIDIIDELGGIDIDVPEYAYDPTYSDCYACPYYPVEFRPGPQHMDGERALAYARIRASDNDFKRIERQQLVIRAVAEKALNLNLLLPTRAISLYRKYKDAVRTDISDAQIPGLALLAQQIGLDNIRMVSIAEATYPCSTCSAAVLLADWDKVEELKARIFGDGRIQAEAARVELWNGSSDPDLAQEVVRFLRRKGLDPDYIAVSQSSEGLYRESTLIVDLADKEYTAQKLAEWLGLPEDRVINGDDPRAAPFLSAEGDVVVVLGADASLAAATAAPPSRGSGPGP